MLCTARRALFLKSPKHIHIRHADAAIRSYGSGPLPIEFTHTAHARCDPHVGSVCQLAEARHNVLLYVWRIDTELNVRIVAEFPHELLGEQMTVEIVIQLVYHHLARFEIDGQPYRSYDQMHRICYQTEWC